MVCMGDENPPLCPELIPGFDTSSDASSPLSSTFDYDWQDFSPGKVQSNFRPASEFNTLDRLPSNDFLDSIWPDNLFDEVCSQNDF